MTYGNGRIYEGEFLRDKFNGKGIFTDPNKGEKYEGDWKDNEKSGEGKMTYGNGDFFEGNWKNNKRNGSRSFIC